MPESDGLLTREAVAKMLGVCQRTVKTLEEQGKLKVLNFGHRTKRYKPEDVRGYIEEVYGI